MPSLVIVHLLVMIGEHFDDRAIDAVFEQTPSLVIWSSFGCLSPHSEGATIVKLKHFSLQRCNISFAFTTKKSTIESDEEERNFGGQSAPQCVSNNAVGHSLWQIIDG